MDKTVSDESLIEKIMSLANSKPDVMRISFGQLEALEAECNERYPERENNLLVDGFYGMKIEVIEPDLKPQLQIS